MCSHGSSSGSDDTFQLREDQACKATSFPSCDVTAIPLFWWEEAAIEVLQTSSNFDLVIRTIKFIPLSDSTMAAAIISKVHQTFIENLFSGKAIKGQLQSFNAEAIVAFIKGKPSSPSRWNGDWFFSTLISSDIQITAEKLDREIHWEFCSITFLEWTAWICGNKSVNVSHLLDVLFNFRNALAEHARQHKEFFEKLVLLEKASYFP